MAKLLLSNADDLIDLDMQAMTGKGYQATSGLTGLGMAPRTVQWTEGAGDGAVYRGKRVTARTLDIILDVLADDRDELKAFLARMELMLAEPFTLTWEEDDGTQWTVPAVFTGGFQYVFGVDTVGDRDLSTVFTVQAGDPYWTSVSVSEKSIVAAGGEAELLADLAAMIVSDSSAIGEISLENTGTAKAYPEWTVYGPGSNFEAISPSGETLRWTGTLTSGHYLVFDTQRGTVVDETGANRYADLDTAPRFWAVPPGVSTVTASLDDAGAGTKIVCRWRARKWLVI